MKSLNCKVIIVMILRKVNPKYLNPQMNMTDSVDFGVNYNILLIFQRKFRIIVIHLDSPGSMG